MSSPTHMPHQASCPPRVATWLVRLTTHEAHVGYVVGDLEETFGEMVEHYGQAEARRWYWSQALRSLKPLLATLFYWCLIMFRNYLKIALRNLRKQKGYAFINIFGLAIGLAFCALIFLFVRDELTYDQFHENADRIFRTSSEWYHADGGVRRNNSNLPFVFAPTAKNDIPEIESVVRFYKEEQYIRTDGEAIEDHVLYADTDLFSLFTFPVLHGDASSPLGDLTGVVLTEAAAIKYFGTSNPVGQTLDIRLDRHYEPFVVRSVVANPPSNSTIQFGIVLPFEVLRSFSEHYQDHSESWDIVVVQTYVGIHSSSTEENVEEKLATLFRTYHAEDIQHLRDAGRWAGSSQPGSYVLQPIREIHLTNMSDPMYSYILSGIALAILLIACINFMTLAIGRSVSRAKEVGIRKVVGAQRKQLMGQFWGEALVFSFLALLIGIGLVYLFLPAFNTIADKNLVFNPLHEGVTVAALMALMVLAGLGAGGYPAIVLSRFKPIETLKNRLRLGGSNGFTKSLVVVQFALSVFLVASTLVMSGQLNYLRTKNLGFDKEQLVVIETSGLDGRTVAERFRNSLQGDRRIMGITAAGNTMGYRGSWGTAYRHEGKTYNLDLFSVETEYLDVMGIALIAGENFDANLNDSLDAVILNEAAVRMFDMTDPIGQSVPGFDPMDTGASPIIIGVTPDYNFQALYQDVSPMVLMRQDFWGYGYVFIRIQPEDMAGSIALLEEAWADIAPDVPFAYTFLDEQMQARYQDDQRWGQIIQYAALFAILVACLGLFGLAALSVANRTKEIGIRKVLGASIGGVALLLARQFAILVIAGILIAAPIAHIVMEKWLENFAFRVDVGIGVLFSAGALALIIALGAVSYQAIKAGFTNPVDALRYE